MRLYFLGIGGTLMGNLAVLAKSLGHEVAGCDETLYPPMSDILTRHQINTQQGFDESAFSPPPDLVVIGNARCSRGHPGIEAVLDQGLRYMSGAEFLGSHILPGRWPLAVAGTHGKTSGASMLAWILEHAGASPGFLIGGAPKNFSSGARLGTSKWFVLEADEYDCSYFDRRAKFLHYRPRTLVINNLEYDHADIYDSLEAIETQFHQLLRSVPASGRVITPIADASVDRVIERGCWSEHETFALQDKDANWRAELLTGDGSAYQVLRGGLPIGEVHWGESGEHMVANALGALAAAAHIGIDPAVGVDALSRYQGVGRRLEVIVDRPGLKVYDDFAHHPTAIAKTLAALSARARAEDSHAEVIAVIEPRSHTMSLGTLRSALAGSTKDATRVFWFKGPGITWDMNYLIEHSSVPARIETSIDELAETLARLPSGAGAQHVVLMSNGSFGGLREKLLARLTERSP
ncbi:MAG: UDP-N-acetylmuramate:L-alanyl-gamma-D-glutamyl-meso-diaminopimelate ligase [Gammaproteobacteria bacterium]|nr:UDP-N-acetylmuramate:L-alanyl-gamma-D-glutamyl-meso-diaminopimelate ligase [Gammaproteobacteria bacterium]